MSWYIECFRKYADFSGRARRKEYWMFFLFNFLFVIGLDIVEAIVRGPDATGPSALVALYQVAVAMPAIAAGVRRMHDTDHSGWWILLPLVNLIFAVKAGQKGDNRFGPDPKAIVIHVAGSSLTASRA